MQASDVALVEEKLDLGTVYENHQKSRIQHCERSELRLHLSGQKLIKNDKNWSKMPKVKCDIFGNFQTLCLGSRIKVVSLLKRILEKKKDRRRQLRFSVVYPIKSYLISNATNVTMFENLKKCLIQHCERSELRLHSDCMKIH